MKAELIGGNEVDRLSALYRYRILDTAAERRFDDFTSLAAVICDAPMSLVSLVDADREWVKSKLGIDVAEMLRELSFSAHAIHVSELLEVRDTLEDGRFLGHPLVTRDPHVRFFAGAPLLTPDGHAIGALCVMDVVPRQLTDTQKVALTTLARQVVRQLESRIAFDREQDLNQRVAEQGEFQKVLLENAVAAVISTDLEGLITSFNPAAERLLGYRAEELIGKHTVSLFYVKAELEARAEALSAELGRVVTARDAAVAKVREGATETREWQYRRKDGSLVPVMLSMSALKGDGAEIIGYVGLAWDDTERRMTEQARLASEARLKMAMDSARMSLWDADLKAQIFTLDARWNELAGYPPKEIKVSFDRMISLLPPRDADEVRAKTGAVIRGERADYFVEHRVRHRDGHMFWVESRGQVVEWDAAGVATRMIGTSIDVTDRKNADRALRESESRLQLAMTVAHTSIWDANPKDGRIFVDVHWAELIGAEPGELETSFQQLMALVPPEEVEGVWAKMLPVVKGEKADYIAEHRVRHCDGHWIWVESRGRVVERDAQGRALRMIGTNTDITERRRIETMKAEFVSTVSHELRTPLTSIKGALGLVCGGVLGAVPEQAKAVLEVALKNSQRLEILINDLLDMEKLLAGEMQFDFQLHELMPLIEHSRESAVPYAQQYQVTILLKERADGVRVRVDASRLQQVMGNFLSNAAKFSPQGGEVDILARQHDGIVRVEVVDHGPGIPENFRDRIFQKFSQADSSDTRQRGGTGLGLAITKELIERMNGHVGFESQPGQGAVFYFELPIALEEDKL